MSTPGLRIALAPLSLLTADTPLQFVWLDADGRVLRAGQESLRQLGGGKASAAVLLLHPSDSVLASVELPPLPEARMTAAVQYAAQSLMLGSLEQFYVSHGPRDSAGRVMLAWLSRSDVQHVHRLMQDCRLKLNGLYPAPYFLPVPDTGEVRREARDDYLLVRSDLHQARVDFALAEQAQEAFSWTGVVPSWGLHQCLADTLARPRHWGRALGCCVLALMVWLTGLNLYASRLAEQGGALKAALIAQVTQAFPTVGMVLNPLQQARQQLAAGTHGSLDDPDQRFSPLLQQAGQSMPFLSGALQSLDFQNGELKLALVDGHKAPVDSTWQAELVKQGIEALPAGHGWTLRVLPSTDNAVAREGGNE